MDLNRKRLTKSQKFNILSEHFDKGTSILELARINKINPVTIYQWKRSMGEKPKETLQVSGPSKEWNHRITKIVTKTLSSKARSERAEGFK